MIQSVWGERSTQEGSAVCREQTGLDWVQLTVGQRRAWWQVTTVVVRILDEVCVFCVSVCVYGLCFGRSRRRPKLAPTAAVVQAAAGFYRTSPVGQTCLPVHHQLSAMCTNE